MKKLLFLALIFIQSFVNDKTYAQTDGNLDPSFVINAGFDNTVMTTVIQPDGKVVAGGFFTTYKGFPRNRIARLNIDGSFDTTFNIGEGFNGVVYTIAQQSDGKIVVGGEFTTYNNVPQNRICRLNTDGSLDTSFVLGTGFGIYSPVGFCFVNTIAIQPDGKIMAAGRFGKYNETSQQNIARINSDGSPDASFYVGSRFNFDVKSIALQQDGKIVAGGSFSSYNGYDRKYIARLNTNGTLDTSFNVGTGFGGSLANNQVNTVAVQPDGKVLVGGYFTTYKNGTQNRIVRLNNDGSVDTSFATGAGFDNYFVNTFAVQPNGKILVGGGFISYNGTDRRCMARLNTDGGLDTTFDIGTGFSGTLSNVETISVHSDGKIIVGGWFTSYKGLPQARIARLNGAELLSVRDSGIKKEMAVYPNPVRETLHFSEEISDFKITELSGKSVIRKLNVGTSVNVEQLIKGVYVVTAITKTGKTITQKIVKE